MSPVIVNGIDIVDMVNGHRLYLRRLQLIANEHVFNSDVFRNIQSESVFKNFRILSKARFALFLALFNAITYIVRHRSYIRLSPTITTDRRTEERACAAATHKTNSLNP